MSDFFVDPIVRTIDPTAFDLTPPWIFGTGGSTSSGAGNVQPIGTATPQSEQSSKSTIFANLLQFGSHIADSLLQAKLYNDSLKAQQRYGATAATYNPNTGQYQQNYLAQIPMVVWIVLALVLGVLIWKKA